LYKIVRRPPCWKSTACLARHARLDLLDWLDKVERVESSRAKWNLSLTGYAHVFMLLFAVSECDPHTSPCTEVVQLQHHMAKYVCRICINVADVTL